MWKIFIEEDAYSVRNSGRLRTNTRWYCQKEQRWFLQMLWNDYQMDTLGRGQVICSLRVQKELLLANLLSWWVTHTVAQENTVEIVFLIHLTQWSVLLKKCGLDTIILQYYMFLFLKCTRNWLIMCTQWKSINGLFVATGTRSEENKCNPPQQYHQFFFWFLALGRKDS